MFAPKIEACSMSLTKPKIREVKMPKELVKIDLNMRLIVQQNLLLKYFSFLTI